MTAHILVEIIAPQFRKELLLQGKPLGLRKKLGLQRRWPNPELGNRQEMGAKSNNI